MSKKIKKFALIGTSSVGKTTLLKRLEKELQKRSKKKTIFVEEAARYYFEKNKVKNPFSFNNQKNIQALAKRFEQNAERKNPSIIICDRSVLDAVAYVRTVGKDKEWKNLLERVKDWVETYDHFFLLDPNGVSYETDKIRKEEKTLRDKFHESFIKVLNEIKVPYTLISGDKRERVNRMLDIIL